MHKWKLALAVLAIALFAAWYAFRPERLVVNHRVNEGFPAGEDPSSAQVLESGTFYGVVHPTTGTATIYRLGDGDRILVSSSAACGGSKRSDPPFPRRYYRPDSFNQTKRPCTLKKTVE